MAPTEQVAHLFARYYCRSGYYSGGVCRSGWSHWGRWVFAGCLIAFVLLVFVCLGCVNSRRRRKRGLHPRYGTGWMAPSHKYHHQNNPGAYAPPPPQYSPGPGGNQYGGQPSYGNQGYYGGHQEGLQQPQGAYYPPRSGDNFYQPPPGPPPGK